MCTVLEIAKHRDVASRLDEDEKGSVRVDTPSGLQNMVAVNESGLYNVIIRSDKPKAKPFRKWITSEVIPTIRKTGGYVVNEDLFINTYLPYADEYTKNLFRMQLNTINQLNHKIEITLIFNNKRFVYNWQKLF